MNPDGRRAIPPAIAATLVTLVALVAGCGTSRPAPSGPPGAGAGAGGNRAQAGLSTLQTAYLVQVQARVLVNGAGYALYMYLPDHATRVTCTGSCARSWPPVFQPGRGGIHTGRGVQPGLVGRDPDPAGGQVVTYDHWPLYGYADDPQAGYATGQGIDQDGGYWYLIRPDGAPLVPSGDPPPSTR